MANKFIQMEIIKQIRLLDELGKGKKTIARELGLSKNTVKSYLLNDNKRPDTLRTERQESLFDFFPYCREELRRKGVTRQILWGEYRLKNPDGYSYTQFCEYFNLCCCRTAFCFWLHSLSTGSQTKSFKIVGLNTANDVRFLSAFASSIKAVISV